MIAVLKTAPAKYPVTLKEAKEHLNITLGWTDDDLSIIGHIKVATQKTEKFLRRKLITQTWYTYYDSWPCGDSIYLPFGKLQSVTSVKYTDTDGNQTEWSTDEYNTDIYSDPGRVILEYGYSWPQSSLHPQNPIVIEFVCGYGDAGSDVEDSIKHAIKLMIDDLYNHRGDIIVGVSSSNMRVSKDLLWPYRLHQRPTE